MSAPVSHPIVEAQKVLGPYSSILKYDEYDNIKKTEEYFWEMEDKYHDGTIKLDAKYERIRLLVYGLSQ